MQRQRLVKWGVLTSLRMGRWTSPDFRRRTQVRRVFTFVLLALSASVAGVGCTDGGRPRPKRVVDNPPPELTPSQEHRSRELNRKLFPLAFEKKKLSRELESAPEEAKAEIRAQLEQVERKLKPLLDESQKLHRQIAQ